MSLQSTRLEARFVVCPACDGEGCWEAPTGWYDHNTGALITEARRCSVCGGDGDVEEEPEHRSGEDFDAEWNDLAAQGS